MPPDAGLLAESFAERVGRLEADSLSPLAVRSYATRGRTIDEAECGVRTPFQRDRDRIVHSKPFRRLKGKTQVFIDPAGDHYRTRMTHTLETTGIARVVARALRLTEALVEADFRKFLDGNIRSTSACFRERAGTGGSNERRPGSPDADANVAARSALDGTSADCRVRQRRQS